jgi:S1-C subfamily serine protease
MRYLFSLLLIFVPLIAFAGIPDDLQNISVTIQSGDSQGSGTLITRKIGDDTITFVWTAGHVVDQLRTTRTVVRDGIERIVVEYRDAVVLQEIQQDGRRVGEVKYDAKIIKVSDFDYGEDLALLMIRRKNAYPVSASARFICNEDYIPPIGVKLVHVGSLLGQFGANSFTNGIISQTGRTLEMAGANMQVFDQVTVTAFPGSSGGGVFLEESGEYIGMLTMGVNQLQGFNFIVPVRRIVKYANKNGLQWAINGDAPMPTMKYIESMPIEYSQSPDPAPPKD